MSAQTQTHRTTATKKTTPRRKSEKKRFEEGASRLVTLINDKALPDALVELLSDVATVFLECFNPDDPELLQRNLAAACEAVGTKRKTIEAEQKWLRGVYFRSVIDKTFEHDHQASEFFDAMATAKFLPDHKPSQAVAISVCLAEVMANPLTPVDLYNAIGDAVAEIEGEVETDYLLRSEGLVPALLSIAANKSGTASSPKPEENQQLELEKYQRAANKLVAFMTDENTPEGLSSAIGNAIGEFVIQHDGTNTNVEVARFQLAYACFKAAHEQSEEATV